MWNGPPVRCRPPVGIAEPPDSRTRPPGADQFRYRREKRGPASHSGLCLCDRALKRRVSARICSHVSSRSRPSLSLILLSFPHLQLQLTIASFTVPLWCGQEVPVFVSQRTARQSFGIHGSAEARLTLPGTEEWEIRVASCCEIIAGRRLPIVATREPVPERNRFERLGQGSRGKSGNRT